MFSVFIYLNVCHNVLLLCLFHNVTELAIDIYLILLQSVHFTMFFNERLMIFSCHILKGMPDMTSPKPSHICLKWGGG